MAEPEETFLSHLIELRERLVKSLVAVGIVFLPALYFSSQLYDILALPLIHALPSGSKMIATGVVTPFLIPVKIAGVAALVMVLPYVLYQAWAFVAPGLYAHEKRLVLPHIEAYFNFVLGMFLAFGLAFEVPVVVVVLVLTGVISVEQLREFRGYVIVGIFTLAA